MNAKNCLIENTAFYEPEDKSVLFSITLTEDKLEVYLPKEVNKIISSVRKKSTYLSDIINELRKQREISKTQTKKHLLTNANILTSQTPSSTRAAMSVNKTGTTKIYAQRACNCRVEKGGSANINTRQLCVGSTLNVGKTKRLLSYYKHELQESASIISHSTASNLNESECNVSNYVHYRIIGELKNSLIQCIDATSNSIYALFDRVSSKFPNENEDSLDVIYPVPTHTIDLEVMIFLKISCICFEKRLNWKKIASIISSIFPNSRKTHYNSSNKDCYIEIIGTTLMYMLTHMIDTHSQEQMLAATKIDQYEIPNDCIDKILRGFLLIVLYDTYNYNPKFTVAQISRAIDACLTLYQANNHYYEIISEYAQIKYN